MLNVIDSVYTVLTTISISIRVSENSFHLFHLFICFIHHDSHLMESLAVFHELFVQLFIYVKCVSSAKEKRILKNGVLL